MEDKMKRIEKFYENTKNCKCHKNVEQFVKLNIAPGNAIELGCGAGRDTIYLIKNGWNVLGIDREDVEHIITEKLSDVEVKRFRFQRQKFENIRLEKCDLLVANDCLPFCDKSMFYEFWKKIVDSILPDGYFVGNFFGVNDEWSGMKENMVFLEKSQVLELFDGFEIVSFDEVEEDCRTGMGIMKHWHTFFVIARKKV